MFLTKVSASLIFARTVYFCRELPDILSHLWKVKCGGGSRCNRSCRLRGESAQEANLAVCITVWNIPCKSADHLQQRLQRRSSTPTSLRSVRLACASQLAFGPSNTVKYERLASLSRDEQWMWVNAVVSSRVFWPRWLCGHDNCTRRCNFNESPLVHIKLSICRETSLHIHLFIVRNLVQTAISFHFYADRMRRKHNRCAVK